MIIRVALVCLALCAAAAAQQPPALTGRVTDAAGAPIEAASVELVEEGIRVWTDAAGSYRLRVAMAGEFTVRVVRIGWLTRTVRIQLRQGSETRLDLQLTPQPLSLDTLNVSAKNATGVRLTRADLHSAGALTVADALARLPGVVVSTSVPGGPQHISVRGSAHDQVLVLVDGVAVNDPVTGAADLSRLPVAMIESVVLLQGAQSARYGGRALAGALIVETRGISAQPSFNLAGGSLGRVQSDAVLGGSAPVGWSAGASWRRLEGAFDFDLPVELGGTASRRANADATSSDIFGAIAAQLGGSVLRARAGFQMEERGLPGRGYAPSPQARQKLRLLRASAAWESVRPERALQLSAGVLRQRNVYRDSAPPFGLPYNDSVQVSALELQGSAERRIGKTLLGGGADARLQYITSATLEQEYRQPGQLGVFLHGARPLTSGGLQSSINAQVRLEHDRGQQREFASHSITLTAARGRLVGHIAHRTGYAPPALGDQFFRESVGVKPNPELRPERVREAELGIRWSGQFGQLALDLNGNAFSGAIRDLIVWAPDYRFIWSPRNEDVLRDGFELRAGAGQGGQWHARAGFAHTRIAYDRPDGADVQVIYRPRQSGTFTLERLTEHVDVRGEVNYTGQRNTAPTTLNALPAFWTTAVAVRTRFRMWAIPAGVDVRVDRLLDERDTLIFGFPDPGRVFTMTLRLGGSHNSMPASRLP